MLTSKDLHLWETTGFTLSDPDANGFRTVTIDMTAPARFMRLMVEE